MSGFHWNRPERSGKGTRSCGKTPEINEKRKQYSGPDISGFFRRFPIVSCGNGQEIGRKSPGKLRRKPVWNTASMKSAEKTEIGRLRGGIFDLGYPYRISLENLWILL
jgi:hypothetical protein